LTGIDIGYVKLLQVNPCTDKAVIEMQQILVFETAGKLT
jgi:hypothetical protein